ncbi:MAG TPA: integrin alpha [Ignavibacteriaceae bacterium]|nr:integrin alpha [Ignavibacteriaceae bacterium]
MKNIRNNFLYTVFLMIITVASFSAQTYGQVSIPGEEIIKQDDQKIDINNKANELGITSDQLQGILNSASNNAGKEPLPEAIQERFFTGLVAGDQFGSSVSSAGDVNGDGYEDIIVGAPNNDGGGSDFGSVYIYFGGSTIDNTADVIMIGEASGDDFGYSVSSARDINGDGYDDVIVGAYANDAGGSNAGRAYIYFGGAIMNNSADVILTGAAAGDLFGFSVSTAGDVNGDGYSDVIVGAYANDAGGSNAGRAYIYFGGSVMNNTADVILTGVAAADFFGFSVSLTGDVNGDGYSDVIVGAYNNDAGGNNAGRAYIYYGGSTMDNTADLILTGAAANDLHSRSVSSAGDVNGDGYSDVIVGAQSNDAGGSNAGRAYIYFGGPAMNNIADVILTGAAANDLFGISVSTAGDVNGDGYSDVVVGAQQNDAGGNNAGRSYIYFGGSVIDDIADVILTGEAADDYFGTSVSSAGDVNGDGYSDVLVGANLNDAGGIDAGRAYLYLNSLTGLDIPDEFFTGAAANDWFGYSVSTAGDVNGDGYDDVIVGANFNDAGGADAGRAYIYFCGPGMNNTADVILTAGASGDNFGYSVSTAGDVNGDGYDDVIVGANFNDAGGTDAGRAYIYYGGSAMNNGVDVTLTGAAANDWFGFSVSTAGDVNGDGYADVIVGAPYYDAVGGSNAGRAYIYFGGSIMDNLADVVMSGVSVGYRLGCSVSTAGDVNGDGFNDLIVGAHGYNAFTGLAYIYFGGPSMDSMADVTMTGEATDNYFGYSVSIAGDVNGDGYDDVIVGASGNNAGRSYIYFGGSVIDDIADVILTGEAADDYFGTSVSSAGDVNGDGYYDVIVGANFNDAGGAEAGRAYIYYGGSNMNNVADVTLTGVAAGDYFGNSVSSAGDVNGDGYSDVIVGAFVNDGGGTDAGRAYLYLSSSPPIKPRIMSVNDVPFDQGGYVHLKWVRSGYDVVGINRVTGYVVERSLPPSVSGFVWEEIANVASRKNPFYLYTASTWSDSMTNNSGTLYFRITAITSDGNEFWRSNILYGHSADNLAPSPPLAFYAQQNGTEVKLGWQANTEKDFRDYYIYRSDTALTENIPLEGRKNGSSIPQESITLLGTTTDTTFTDPAPLSGTAYYYISAYDIHDNGSAFSTDSIEATLSANIKVFLQGPYSSGSMSTTLNSSGYIPLVQPYNTAPWNYNGGETVASIPAGVVDWVLLELRSDLTTQVARRGAFVKSDGSLTDIDGVSLVDFPGVAQGNYYLVIYHRNHLPIMTANTVELSKSPTLYDLTTASTQAYGTDPMKDLGGGIYGLYSGDTNISGIVTAADKSLVNSFNLSAGYYNADTNFSGIVTAADKTNINSNNLKQEFVP